MRHNHIGIARTRTTYFMPILLLLLLGKAPDPRRAARRDIASNPPRDLRILHATKGVFDRTRFSPAEEGVSLAAHAKSLRPQGSRVPPPNPAFLRLMAPFPYSIPARRGPGLPSDRAEPHLWSGSELPEFPFLSRRWDIQIGGRSSGGGGDPPDGVPRWNSAPQTASSAI